MSQHSSMVSIVIPAYNGGEKLVRCLEAIRACVPAAHEVIVVDDGSSDGSAQVAREWGVRVLSTDHARSGPAAARNIGAETARGDVLLFVDADVAIHADVVGRVHENFQLQDDLAACFGSYDDEPSEANMLSQYKNLFHHFVHQSARGDTSTFWAGCGAIRREIFLSVGGFSLQFERPAIEDIELGYRLKAAGYVLRLDKQMQCKHLKRWTWHTLLRSDIFDRGVPWTELILHGGFVNDLNLQTHNRISVVGVYLLLAMLLAGLVIPALWWPAAGLSIMLLILNRSLYRFFAARRGWYFAFRAIALHWLYYLYNGVSFGLGLYRYLEMPRAVRTSYALLAIVLLAALLRFANLGSDSLWYDELLQADIASRDLPALLAQLNQHAAVPLDYLITHAVLMWDRSEFLLRFPAACFGILTVVLTYVVGFRLMGRKVGLMAALFLAVSGLHAFYSQEMRPYALYTFLATLSFYALIRALQDGHIRHWIVYSLLLVAGVFTQLFTLFVLAAQILIVLAARFRDRVSASSGVSLFKFGVSLAPMLIALALTPWFGSILDIGRLFVLSLIAPSAVAADAQLGAIRGEATALDVAFLRDRLLGNIIGGEPILSIVFLLVLVTAIIFGLRRARWQTLVLLTWVGLPTALIIFFLRHRGTFFAIRYVLFMLPPLAILLAIGVHSIDEMRRRITFRLRESARMTTSILTVVTTIAVLSLAVRDGIAYVSTPREDWRLAGQLLRENVRAGDVVIAPQRTDLVFFYARDLPGEIRASTIPFDLPRELEVGQRLWLVVSKYIYPPDAYPTWISLRPSTEFRIDDTIQIYLIERIVP